MIIVESASRTSLKQAHGKGQWRSCDLLAASPQNMSLVVQVYRFKCTVAPLRNKGIIVLYVYVHYFKVERFNTQKDLNLK